MNGDLVMADRGITIHEAVALQNATLAIHSFLGKQTQMPNKEVEDSRGLARIRIHGKASYRCNQTKIQYFARSYSSFDSCNM
jgi:hypothetical protein